jgi:hypothetical protein
MKRAVSITSVLVLLLFSGMALGEQIPNWLAPPTWTPTFSGGGLTKFVDLSGPLPFIPITPCRVIDTRGNGFMGEWGQPPMPGGGTQRSFTIGGQCGIPSGAAAVSFNFTVWAPPTGGDIRVFPTGYATPMAATMLYQGGVLGLSNAAVAPLGTAGKITVQVDGPGTINLIVDVNGYYAATPANAQNWFEINNNSSNYTLWAQNSSTTCTGDCGIVGLVLSGTALWGSSAKSGDGVWGTSMDASGSGVHGVLTPDVDFVPAVWGEHQNTLGGGVGVKGSHAGSGLGVLGVSAGATGSGAAGVAGKAYSTAHGTVGVDGHVWAASGRSFGVLGACSSNTSGAAGVKGVDHSGDANGYIWPAGVIGTSVSNYGMYATSQWIAVKGVLLNSSGILLSAGYLGADSINGVYATGNVGASGLKTFVEPHPSDPAMVIRYAALEGPEAGTYFRGSGETAGGVARIPVPESFRTVTEEEGLTVQLTPVGGLTQMTVVKYDLDEIVVRSSRDTKFFIHVHGVRRGYRDWESVAKGTEYVPESPDQKMPVVFSSEIRRRLVANGTYNEDGTVRMETAERQGWARKWEERAKASAAPAPKVSTAPSNN